MSDEADVTLSRGVPETVLPAPPAEWTEALSEATATAAGERFVAIAAVAAAHPRFLDAWAHLAELAGDSGDHVAAYAYARVGYHRGLDALRGAGWRGTGYVRWRSPTNRGFLRSLDALRREAGAIGEQDEAERCSLFLHQLDTEWGRSSAT